MVTDPPTRVHSTSDGWMDGKALLELTAHRRELIFIECRPKSSSLEFSLASSTNTRKVRSTLAIPRLPKPSSFRCSSSIY